MPRWTVCSQFEHCRAMHLTTRQFMQLGGEEWTQSMLIRVGKEARRLHKEILGKVPKKVRASTKPEWRNKVGKYPCGILEQAYRNVQASKDAILSDKAA